MQADLRNINVITESEVAIKIGDKYIAENILTRARREISIPSGLLEGTGNKRVLKG
jgi:hypothetical protein